MAITLLTVLEKERKELLKKISLIDQMIGEYQRCSGNLKILNNNIVITNIEMSSEKREKYLNYNINSSIRHKIVTIIKNENKFLHVREIANIAHQFERDIPIKIFIKKISPALSVLKNIPDTSLAGIEVANSHFNTFWGSKAWLTDEGEIKNEYMYNIKELSKNNKVVYRL